MSAQQESKWLGGNVQLFNILKVQMVAAPQQRVVQFENKGCVDAYVSTVTEVAAADPALGQIRHVGTVEYYHRPEDQRVVLAGGGHRFHITFCIAIVLRYLGLRVYSQYTAAVDAGAATDAAIEGAIDRLLSLVNELASCFVQRDDRAGNCTMNYVSNMRGQNRFLRALAFFRLPADMDAEDLDAVEMYPHIKPSSRTHNAAFASKYCQAFEEAFCDSRMLQFATSAMFGYRHFSMPVTSMLNCDAVVDILHFLRTDEPRWLDACVATSTLAAGCATAIKVESLKMNRPSIMDSNKFLSPLTPACRIHSAIVSRLGAVADSTAICLEINTYIDTMTSLVPFQATTTGLPMDASQVQVMYLHASLFKHVLAKTMALSISECTALEKAKSTPAACGAYMPRSDTACEFLALRYCSSAMAVSSLMAGEVHRGFANEYLWNTASLADLDATLGKLRGGNYPTLVAPVLSLLETFYYRVTGTRTRLCAAYREFAITETWDYLQTLLEHSSHFDDEIFGAAQSDEDTAVAAARKLAVSLYGAYENGLRSLGGKVCASLRQAGVGALVGAARLCDRDSVFFSFEAFRTHIRLLLGPELATAPLRVKTADISAMCGQLASEIEVLISLELVVSLSMPRRDGDNVNTLVGDAQDKNFSRPTREHLTYPTWVKSVPTTQKRAVIHLDRLMQLMPSANWTDEDGPEDEDDENTWGLDGLDDGDVEVGAAGYDFPLRTAATAMILAGRDRVLGLAGFDLAESLGDATYKLAAESLVAISVFRLNASNKVLYNVLQRVPEYAGSTESGELPRRTQVLKCDNATVTLPKGLATSPLPVGDFVIPYDLLVRSALIRTGRRRDEDSAAYCAVRALPIADRYDAFMQHAHEAVSVITWGVYLELKRLFVFSYGTKFAGEARPPLGELAMASTRPQHQGRAKAKAKAPAASRKRKATMPDVETVHQRSLKVKRRIVESSDEASEAEEDSDSDCEEIGETDSE
ncbi:hypothetical protein SARC_00098 [Sphaeroforma arctica JP610]|uniref:Uncharacterized protein n=1 Tax=Sphaeroforma arctica JP610 TaxID=667725 RepID=A0A0L0GG80_9EUKA|nr:hypothetical protein SARC_00098 [Sphaeroforma arctica JP610]KNC87841.1 hypothetical protein SARC_00098 [Sphaeroforma arctica JP610]|eukprot:XP_014161743.1 hypothetical protein SARC_00098 [Sphaeroforma arctica JP610]